MRRIIAVAVAIGMLALGGAAPAVAQETTVFQAQLTQASLVSVSCEAGVCVLVFQGSGAANIMGPITWTAQIVQDFTTSPCSEALAEITLVGATGSITVTDNAGFVCPSPSPSGGFITSVWEVTGGTGEFSGISGSGTSRGPIGGGGPVVHLSGTVSF
jgi:hypothetical protein